MESSFMSVMSLFFFTCFSLICFSNGELLRPRGVAISKASLYKPGTEFTCIDGSAVLPYDRINDDYCDCFDGSDEPGTSACPNGMYHCTNAGHKPRNIPSSWVNDGICDCCDGSDEYEIDKQCDNTCKELGKKAREDEEVQQQLLQDGHQVYMEYVTSAQEAREEKQKRLEELESIKQSAEDLRHDKQAAKELAESPEKEAKDKHRQAWDEQKEKRRLENEKLSSTDAFQDLDVNTDNFVSVEEMQNRLEFDIDGNGEVSADEAKEYLEDNDQVDLSMFTDVVWPQIKQMYKAPTKDSETEPLEEIGETVTPLPPPDNIPEPPPMGDDEEDYYPEEAYDDEDDEDEHDEYDDEDDEGKMRFPRRGDVEVPEDYWTNDEDKDKEEDEFNKMAPYDEETQKLIDEADKARKEYDEADHSFRELEKEIGDINKYLELDLGPNHSFYPLKGQCYEFTDREYVYRLCPFDKANQRSKSGGSETSLGTWGQWSGPPEDKYTSFKLDKGQSCWNGPARSVEVKLHCGMQNTLTAASEPNRCEYEYHFTTPAACSAPPKPVEKDHEHTEL